MNAIVQSILASIVTGLVPLAVAALAYRQARSASRISTDLESRKIDAEAYSRAQAIYRDAIETLESQLRSARDRITELERRLAELENA